MGGEVPEADGHDLKPHREPPQSQGGGAFARRSSPTNGQAPADGSSYTPAPYTTVLKAKLHTERNLSVCVSVCSLLRVPSQSRCPSDKSLAMTWQIRAVFFPAKYYIADCRW
jgi:hypothetical protein